MLILSKVWSFVSTAVILSIFVLIGYWGHQTHWTIGGNHSDEGHEAQVENVSNSATPLELAVVDDLTKSGICVEPVRLESIREVIPAMASVAYDGLRIAQLSTRAEGHVQSVFTKLGQQIRKGDVLALIDSQIVGEAKSDWLQKSAATRYLRRTLETLQQTGDGVLPLKRIRDAEAELRESQLASFMAQQRLMNLGFSIDFELKLDDSPDQLAEQIRFLGIPSPLLESLPSKPTTANLIAIIAPFDGVVVEQTAVAGEMVSPSNYQFVIADTSTMWIKMSVRREDASKLAVGREVEFYADGLKQPLLTKLAWISAEIDAQTQTIQAGCEVENPIVEGIENNGPYPEDRVATHRLLRANQFGTAKIYVSNQPHALLVPETAVQRMPDQQSIIFVCSANGKSFEPRNVEVGLRQNGMIQILSGVQSGESVASEGSFILKSELMRASLIGG